MLAILLPLLQRGLAHTMKAMDVVSQTPQPLTECGGAALQWQELLARVADGAESAPGRAAVLALVPSRDRAWLDTQHARVDEMRRLVRRGAFAFREVIDPATLTAKAAIDGAALEPAELLRILALGARLEAWRVLVLAAGEDLPAIATMSSVMLQPEFAATLAALQRALEHKLEPDGSVADDASPELRRIRQAMARQHRTIHDSLQRALTRLGSDNATQQDTITVRGERFVIPVKAEFRRRVPGVVHGMSSTGQTVFVEPQETVEANNELVRLLDEEQSEIHRILVAMTRAVALAAHALESGAHILTLADAAQASAKFAELLGCVRPVFLDDDGEYALEQARHPLLTLRLRDSAVEVVPLTLIWGGSIDHAQQQPIHAQRQLIVSGPNTGGKTVTLKTAGLCTLMAQAGIPVPAARAVLPIFTAVYADIGDAQSIDNSLSTFSAHITNLNRIARAADAHSLVLLDELGSATDPDEGAALAVAFAEHFLRVNCWSIITTHLTALKVHAARHAGVMNAAVGFDEATLAPTYRLHLGVPGASAGINIAARLGLPAEIVESARQHLGKQAEDIGRFLDDLHAQRAAAEAERASLAAEHAAVLWEKDRLEREGKAEQRAQTKALGARLEAMLEAFEKQMRQTATAFADKRAGKTAARDAALQMATLRRELTTEFQSASAGSTQTPIASAQAPLQAGDTVRVRSLRMTGTIARLLESDMVEVTAGSMKMRVPLADLERSTEDAPAKPTRGRGSITVSTSASADSNYPREINVIGKTVDEAEPDVARFIDGAFLAGMGQVRVVHGVGMGALRRALRAMLQAHPHVAGVSEPAYNEGGQGATLVDLRS
jgi:DNA mismatch repair protein MutS2